MRESSLIDQHVLVLGASSGLGAETAIHLAGLGARVSLFARRGDRLETVRARCTGVGHETFEVDATDGDALSRCFEEAYRRSGVAGGLVHSVGNSIMRPLQILKSAFAAEMFALNVTTALFSTKLLLTKMRPGPGASVVWISSVQAALAGGAGTAVYAATKGALNSAMHVAALELAPRGIRVNTINAGMVETDIWESQYLDREQKDRVAARHPLGPGRPRDIASAVAFLLSDEARWITGTTLVVDGGYSCHNAPIV